jgi:hypothetical protein
MCLSNRIRQLQSEKAALDAQILQFEQLESKTQPIVEMLKKLIEDYREIAPEELPSLLTKISEMCFFDLSADKSAQEESEFKQSGFQSLLEYEITTGQAMENTAPQPEYEPEECQDTIESIFMSKGFFQLEDLEDFGADEKYDTYRGWDIYYSLPNGGIVAIGLYNSEYNQQWDASTEYTQEVDPTFPESLADFAEIVAWTRSLIDRVESFEAPGQLTLEFPGPSDTENQGDEKTELQRLLEIKHHFVFGSLHVGVKIESVFTETRYDEETDEEAFIEEALIEVSDSIGKSREYYEDAELLLSKYKNNLEQVALDYAEKFQQELRVEETLNKKLSSWKGGRSAETAEQSLSEADSWDPKDFGDVQHNAEPDGQLNLLEWNVSEPPDPDDFDSIEDYQDAFEEWEAEQEERPVDSDTEACTEPQEDNEEPRVIRVKSVCKKWDVTITDRMETKGYMSMLFMGKEEGFTYLMKEEELQQFPGTWLVHVERILADKVKKNEGEGEAPDPDDYENAEDYQRAYFEWEADRKKNHITDPRIEIFKGTVTLKHNISAVVTPSMHTKCNKTELAGVTFKFLNLGTEFYSTSQTPGEIEQLGLGFDPETVASTLLERWQKREEEKNASPTGSTHAEPEKQDDFTELVRLSNEVAYLKRKDNGQILAGYLAFSNKLPDGRSTDTKAKSRSQKWVDWLQGTFQLECDKPRAPKRMVSGNNKQPFAYEVKVKGVSLGQLTKLVEEDFSLLPGEMALALPPAPPKQEESFDQRDDVTGDGLSEEEYLEAVEEELSGNDLSEGCALNEDEIELVEMAKSGIESCDSEAVKSVNSVFKEVCTSGNASREKVWNALTENQQQTYKLLLQMAFVEAPDFAPQTPEFLVFLEEKQVASIWLTLRTINGVPSRIWRYKGQRDEIGYKSKEVAAIAAIQATGR